MYDRVLIRFDVGWNFLTDQQAMYEYNNIYKGSRARAKVKPSHIQLLFFFGFWQQRNGTLNIKAFFGNKAVFSFSLSSSLTRHDFKSLNLIKHQNLFICVLSRRYTEIISTSFDYYVCQIEFTRTNRCYWIGDESEHARFTHCVLGKWNPIRISLNKKQIWKDELSGDKFNGVIGSERTIFT